MTTRLLPIGQFVVRPDHPSLSGHFPGRPIVPGVVVLDHALALILERTPNAELAAVVTSKFSAVLLPDQVVDVSCGDCVGSRLDFCCAVAGTTVASGTLRLHVR